MLSIVLRAILIIVVALGFLWWLGGHVYNAAYQQGIDDMRNYMVDCRHKYIAEEENYD